MTLDPMFAVACGDFAPDTLGDDPEVCSGCLWHHTDHRGPHYPTTAELAAFRRSIRPDWYARTFPPDRTGENGYAWPMAPLDASPNRVARKYGIGDASRGPEGHLTVKARREAARMRSAEYEAIAQESATDPWMPGDRWAWDRALETFCPERTAGLMREMRASLRGDYCPHGSPLSEPTHDDHVCDEDTLHCDLCDVVETAADLTPDWNGETGNHLSCEARASLNG